MDPDPAFSNQFAFHGPEYLYNKYKKTSKILDQLTSTLHGINKSKCSSHYIKKLKFGEKETFKDVLFDRFVKIKEQF
jgi:hypothetical protein